MYEDIEDVNAAFDSIVLVEDELVKSGFQEGYSQVNLIHPWF